ncbi:hypothetical protein NP233_g13109 [Leucocoprinus birnbaumii]|uniref:Uncharacterized protein n=1 Tax=Leucocoprinus birnbaumii TaxID=56174 RepID=A0AAD5VEJ2_9AGAR|nr:hypothetical protein NP233_g13109 [Leucocoprinus birnbaumii]
MLPPTQPASWRQIEDSYARTYPWRTTYIFKHKRLADGVDEFLPPYREAVKLSLSPTPIPTISRSLVLRADALNALFNYRLVDQLAATLRTKVNLRRRTRVSYSPYMRSILEAELSLSWIQLLGETRINWNAYLEHGRVASKNTPTSEQLSLPTNTRSLLIHAAQYAHSSSQSIIAIHYATVVCYLRFLVEYNTPYLSDSPGRLLKALDIKPETLKLPPKFHLLTPIVLMVSISPLMLLDPSNLSAREFGAANHTKMWFRTRLEVPARIGALEQFIMGSVLSVGFGGCSPTQALRDVYQRVSLNLLPAFTVIRTFSRLGQGSEDMDQENEESDDDADDRRLEQRRAETDDDDDEGTSEEENEDAGQHDDREQENEGESESEGEKENQGEGEGGDGEGEGDDGEGARDE